MDPSHIDNETASISDEERKNIFIKLAKEFEKDEDYLLPIITPPVNSPPIENLDNLNFLNDLQKSEITINQPRIGEPIVRGDEGKTMQTMTVPNYSGGMEEMGSFQNSCFPMGSGGEGSSHCLIDENMIEQASQNRCQPRDENKKEAATLKLIRRRIKNRESAARSRSRKQAYNLQMQLEINNLKEEIQFENKVLAFLGNQNTRTGGRQNGLKRTNSAFN